MIIIADASGLISTFIKKDQNHKLAKKIKEKTIKDKSIIYLPHEVFSETINVVGRKVGHDAAVDLGKTLLETDLFFILPSSYALINRALELLYKQAKSVSFTDCLVMAFADEYETKEIFGFDEAFHKNGYVRIGIDKNPLAP